MIARGEFPEVEVRVVEGVEVVEVKVAVGVEEEEKGTGVWVGFIPGSWQPTKRNGSEQRDKRKRIIPVDLSIFIPPAFSSV